MTSLSDQIDRLSRHTKSIRSTTATTGISSSGRRAKFGVAGPFTRAVLCTPLGDLIRDIDPSELGLFNLVNPPGPRNSHNPENDFRGALGPEVARVEFLGATPLRKPTGRREEVQKPKEVEPEVYAQAALKYLDR